MFLQQGGSTVTGATIVDASVSLADLASTARVDRYVFSQLTEFPVPVWNSEGVGGVQQQALGQHANTELDLALFKIRNPITINKLSFCVLSVGVAGVLKFVMYEEDGQTKILDEDSASISAGGVYTISLGTPLELSAKNYWIGVMAKGTASIDTLGWNLAALGDATLWTTGVTGKPVVCAKPTVTANTAPTTFTPSGLAVGLGGVVVRLDN